MNYQNLIKKIRDELIISQIELSQILGVSFSTVNRWEKGYHEPTIKIKRRIIQLCKENNINIKQDEFHD